MTMPIFNQTFVRLLNEAQLTKEMLGSGATQIRNANYASKGIYFQAFTSLSTGLERIGKLCLILDHYINTGGTFPDFEYLRGKIGHKILILYKKSQEVVIQQSIRMAHLQDLSDPVHQAILRILHDFAIGDRYSNINFLVGRESGDPIASWFNDVDLPLYRARISKNKKKTIARNAANVAGLMGGNAMVLHTSETGSEITDFEEASKQTGIFLAVAPYRQLYVLQIIRYWVDLLCALQDVSRVPEKENIPYFSEIFGGFRIKDSYLRTRKTWNDI
jgi:hypothetical protein